MEVAVFMQARFRQSRGAWIGFALVAVLAGTVPGSHRFAVCIAADGHLDLKLVAQPCRNCPVTECADGAISLAAPAPPLAGGERCCLDLPLSFDLVGWLTPHRNGPQDGDPAGAPTLAPAVAPALAAIPPHPLLPRPGDPPPVCPSDRDPASAASLACTVLRL
jgi:hypothetical protein